MLPPSVAWLLFVITSYFWYFCSGQPQCTPNDNSIEFEDVSLNLIQRSAQLKRQQDVLPSFPAKRSVNSSSGHNSQHGKARSSELQLTLAIGSRFRGYCTCSSSFCQNRFLTPSAHFNLEASIRFGILGSRLSNCADHTSSRGRIRHSVSLAEASGQISQSSQHQASVSIGIGGMSLLMTCAICAIYLVCTCIFGVLSAPSLYDDHLRKVKTYLVDETSARQQGFYHWLSMSWLDRMIGWCGKASDMLQIDHLFFFEIPDHENSEAYARIRDAWDAELQEKGVFGASIFGMIWRVIGVRMFCALIVCAWAVAFLEYVGMVLALDVLLSSLAAMLSAREPDPFYNPVNPIAIVVASLFVLPLLHRCCNVLLIMLDGHFTRLFSVGIGCLLYEKSLRLPVGSAYNSIHPCQANTQPTIAQLLSMDIANEGACVFKTLALMTAMPLILLILFTYLLWEMRLAGLVSMLVLVPSMFCMVASTRHALMSKRQYQSSQDSRIHSLVELFQSWRRLRAVGHQETLLQKVNEARGQELEASQMHNVCMSLASANVHISIWFIAVGSLVFHGMIYGSMDVQHMWIVFQLIASLQACTSCTIAGFGKLLHLPTSFTRLANFLRQSERPSDVVRIQCGTSDLKICGSFTFEEGAAAILHNIDLSLSRGDLVFIVGAEASGKSALLQVALGELYPVGLSHVTSPSDVAYISQNAWLLDGTLQDNVLMGQHMDQQRYREALEVAGLSYLFKSSSGDQVLIGSSYHNLSKVDSMRVALARAAYAKSNSIVLVDAMDQMNQDMLENTLASAYWRDSTRVIVMRLDSHLLQLADRILVVDGGRIALDGHPDVVLSDPVFQSLASPSITVVASDNIDRENRDPRIQSCTESTDPHLQPLNCGTLPLSGLTNQTCKSDEPTQSRMQLQTMCNWIWAGGAWRFAFVIISMLSQCVLQFFEFLGLAAWANNAEITTSCNHRFYACLILTLVLSSGILLCACEWLISSFGKHASEQIHKTLLRNVLRTTKSGLPVGYLMNRFSRDMAKLDCTAASLYFKMIRIFCGTLIQQAYVISLVPFSVAFCACPVYFSMVFFGSCYRCAVAPLLHFANQNGSCLQEMLGCNLEAHLSIRSNGFRRLLIGKHYKHLHLVAQANYFFTAALKAWLTLRVTFCSCVLVSGLVLYAILVTDAIGVGTLGLLVSLFFAFLADFEVMADLAAQNVLTSSAMQRVMSLGDNRDGMAQQSLRDKLQCQTCVLEADGNEPGDKSVKGS